MKNKYKKTKVNPHGLNPIEWGINYLIEKKGIEKCFEEGILQSVSPTTMKEKVLDGKVISSSTGEKLGRNSKCVCGSGKKFKKCCMNLEVN